MLAKNALLSLALGIICNLQDVTATITACDNAWMPYEGYCYFFGPDKLNFADAEVLCQGQGSDLVEVTSQIENDFLKSELKRFKPLCAWIGAKDDIIEGNWHWQTNNGPINYTDWHPGQTATAGQDCAAFWEAMGYQWADYYCKIAHCIPLCKKRGVREILAIVG